MIFSCSPLARCIIPIEVTEIQSTVKCRNGSNRNKISILKTGSRKHRYNNSVITSTIQYICPWKTI